MSLTPEQIIGLIVAVGGLSTCVSGGLGALGTLLAVLITNWANARKMESDTKRADKLAEEQARIASAKSEAELQAATVKSEVDLLRTQLAETIRLHAEEAKRVDERNSAEIERMRKRCHEDHLADMAFLESQRAEASRREAAYSREIARQEKEYAELVDRFEVVRDEKHQYLALLHKNNIEIPGLRRSTDFTKPFPKPDEAQPTPLPPPSE